jgi:hypothetical protein
VDFKLKQTMDQITLDPLLVASWSLVVEFHTLAQKQLIS